MKWSRDCSICPATPSNNEERKQELFYTLNILIIKVVWLLILYDIMPCYFIQNTIRVPQLNHYKLQQSKRSIHEGKNRPSIWWLLAHYIARNFECFSLLFRNLSLVSPWLRATSSMYGSFWGVHWVYKPKPLGKFLGSPFVQTLAVNTQLGPFSQQ